MNTTRDSASDWISSAALFLAANAVGYYAILQNSSDASISSNSYLFDDDERNSSDSQIFYFQRRLQHRLSFPKYPETANGTTNDDTVGLDLDLDDSKRHNRTVSFDEAGEDELQTSNRSNLSTATQYSVDFYPQNSNWNHFESFEELNTRRQKFTRRTSNPLHSATEDEVQKGHMKLTRESKKSSAIYMSLEGERIVKGNSLGQLQQFDAENNTPQSLQSTDNEREEVTEDDDDDDESEESTNFFSFGWGGRKAAPRSRRRDVRTPMPVIMSERNFETTGLGGLQLQPSSLQSSVAGDAVEDANSEEDTPSQSSVLGSKLHRDGNMERKSEAKLVHTNSNVQLPRPPDRKRLQKRATSDPLSRSESNLTVSSARVRANYNARIMPNKLVLIRHGQSMGNIDETLYSTTADNAIPLTKLGWLQAREAGQRLRQIVKGSNDVHFIVSPYVRTVETFHGIASAWLDPNDDEFASIKDPALRRKAWYAKLCELGLSWAEDPRIREQDFGNLQDPTKIKQYKKERNCFGAFYYRFAHGESAADVFDRISTFLDSLWRSFDVHPARNFVLITHGISIRVLMARYFRYTIDQFHCLSNPRNCEMVVMKHDGRGRLNMAGRHELETLPNPNKKDNRKDGCVDGCDVTLKYKYHKRLRCLPPEFVRKVNVRISYEQDA